MSVIKTKLVTVTGHRDLLDNTIKTCVESKIFQPEPAGNHLSSLKHYHRSTEENPYKEWLDRLQNAAGSIGKEPCLLEEPCTLSLEECQQAIASFEEDFSQLSSELDTLTKEVAYCTACMTQLDHFQSMDFPLRDLFDCQFLDIRFGRLPKDAYPAVMSYAEKTGDLIFTLLSTDEEYCWGMYMTPSQNSDEADLTLGALFFERLHIPDAASTPAHAIELLKEQLEPDQKRMEEIKEVLSGYWEKQNHLYDRIFTYLTRQNRLFELRKYAAFQGNRFILMGWVPKNELASLTQGLEGLGDVEITTADGSHVDSLSPPVQLRNNRLARPFEFYTKMFGMPTSGEVDPTPFIAITYTLLYGIMFADVGQGLILALVGYFFMYKAKGMALGKLLVPCGISGAVFGLVFGSVFGYEHWLDPMYRAMGFQEKPIEIMDSGNIMTVLFTAVGIGVVLMVVALCINIYSQFKRKRPGVALFHENGLTGLILYVSAIVLVLSLILGWSIPTVVPLLGILIPVVLLWLKEPLVKLADGHKNWQPESWGGYLVQGFFELFEALLSYVTNTVSFLRVGAFVLVHASMMMVFMSLSEMAGGWLGVVIMVFGNVFVLALEGLLVGVQCLRLEFYEMFNRFFEGSGREFQPLEY